MLGKKRYLFWGMLRIFGEFDSGLNVTIPSTYSQTGKVYLGLLFWMLVYVRQGIGTVFDS